MSCLNLNKIAVKKMLLQIVKAYPYSQCKSPKAFGLVNGFDSMMLPNLGKTFDDYLNGSFWAMDWEAAGADPELMKREFPLVLLETPEFGLPKAGQKECRKYAITVIGQYDCKECKGCNRTKEQVGCDTENILKNILIQFMDFGHFQTDTGENVWANIEHGNKKGWTYLERSILKELCEQDLEPYEISKGMPNQIGWTVQFELCDCLDIEKVDFDYSEEEDLKVIGITECEDCP